MTILDQINPIYNHLIVTFLDGTAGGEFISKAHSGILLATMGDEQGDARWAKVLKRGPDVIEDIQVGTYVLIEPKMWTVGVMLDDDQRLWRTDDTKILAVSDEALYRY